MRKDSGLTLIEILVAMTIFTFIMVYGTAFFNYGRISSQRAKLMDFALNAARDRVEILLATPYASTSSWSANVPYSVSGTTFTMRVDPHQYTEYGSTLSYTIYAVTVSWTSQTGNGSVGLQTIWATGYATYVP